MMLYQKDVNIEAKFDFSGDLDKLVTAISSKNKTTMATDLTSKASVTIAELGYTFSPLGTNVVLDSKAVKTPYDSDTGKIVVSISLKNNTQYSETKDITISASDASSATS